MIVEVRVVDPTKEDISFIDGPWSNDACKGYAIMAMRRAGIDDDTIKNVSRKMTECFDDTAVKEAADYYIKGSVY